MKIVTRQITHISRFGGILLILVGFLMSSCKKKDNPNPEQEEETPKPELVLLLDKVTVKETVTIQPPQGDAFEQEYVTHYMPEYSADSLLIKVTQQFDAPGAADYWNQQQDTYDTYEYKEDRLVKHNLYRRRSLERGAPIELLNYYSYSYDDAGQVSGTSYYSSQRVPPNGDYEFRETSQTTYRYDNQQQLVGYETRSFNYVGGGTTKITAEARRYEYVYNSDGNIEKMTSYFGFDSNSDGQVSSGEISKETEIGYSGYNDHPNPVYQSGLLTGNLLGLFPLFKHLPETASKTAFLPEGYTPSTLSSTDRYTVTYREDGYPSQIQVELENKSINQGGTVNTQERDIVMEFGYRE